MNAPEKIRQGLSYLTILIVVLCLDGCESADMNNMDPELIQLEGFPAFITPIEEYFTLQIAGNHHIDGDSYRLKVSGAIDRPGEYSLEDLRNMKLTERTLTVECIENRPNSMLLGTATWKGFEVYELLKDLGIQEDASFVKYLCSDGYFTYNTLEEMKSKEVLGALYMNNEIIPEKYGFPLRILYPGYYGVRQPGWVVEIQVLKSGTRDFWGETQFEKWNTDSAMAIDSKIFFPKKTDTLILGEKQYIGGAAYGSKRISAVDITLDNGTTWIPAIIKQSMNMDYIWVFWEAEVLPLSIGNLTIKARATGFDGRLQPPSDDNYLDGNNAWPSVTVHVKNKH